MKSNLRRLRRSSKLTSRTDKRLENIITKIIERKMRNQHLGFNLFNHNIYRSTGRDFFGLMHTSDNRLNFGHTPGHILAALAQSIQKAMLRNL